MYERHRPSYWRGQCMSNPTERVAPTAFEPGRGQQGLATFSETCGVRFVLPRPCGDASTQRVLVLGACVDSTVSPIDRMQAVCRSDHHSVRSSHAALLPYLLKVCSRGADPRLGGAHISKCLYDPHLRNQETQPRLGPLAASILPLRWAYTKQAPQSLCLADRGHRLWLCTSTTDI